MIRYLVLWPTFLFVRILSVIAWIVAIAGFLAGMALLFALDYDVDVGGGVGWGEMGIRIGAGLGLFVAGIPFGALGGYLWGSAAKIIIDEQKVNASPIQRG